MLSQKGCWIFKEMLNGKNPYIKNMFLNHESSVRLKNTIWTEIYTCWHSTQEPCVWNPQWGATYKCAVKI